MKIIYTYSNCSPHKYKELIESSGLMILQQAQKYHQLLLEGLRENDVDIAALSCLPVNRQLTKKWFFVRQKDNYKKINYIYLPFINMPLIRNLLIFAGSFIETAAMYLKDRNTVILCDILNISVSTGALLASKLVGARTVGIVTDVPGIFAGNTDEKVSSTQRINQFVLSKFSSYVFLTQQMNELINRKNKPFIVIEGHVDINMDNVKNVSDEKYDIKVCIYAGTLKKIYGIKVLTEAFIKAGLENAELHIYGDGDFREELIAICAENEKVKYFGIKPNDFIVEEQLKATLLINPRPSSEEYTKYSFPSKNMEYMVSGTPTLTTKLPGMPEEYYDIVYLFEDESVDGMTQTLQYILSKSREELYQMGVRAKEFVLTEKNNKLQANKIIKMIEGMDR